jgi:delta 1-pyrroline-5-carboxylate dehydrogenase
MSKNRLQPNLDPLVLAKELSGKQLIGGAMVASRSGHTFDNVNAAAGAVIGQTAEGNEADLDAAVEIAASAQKAWAKLPARERGKLITECGRILNEHVEELAGTLEQSPRFGHGFWIVHGLVNQGGGRSAAPSITSS